jgi:hypothetical protein
LLKNSEKVLKKYFRYLFRYPERGFPSTPKSKNKQKRAKRWAPNPPKATKNQETNSHVAVVKNTNNVVVSKKSPVK